MAAKPKPTVDNLATILETVDTYTQAFERAVGAARDKAIEGTAKATQHLKLEATVIRQDVKSTEINTRMILSKEDETLAEVAHMNSNLSIANAQSEKKDEHIRVLINDVIDSKNKIVEREIGFYKQQLESKTAVLQFLIQDKKGEFVSAHVHVDSLLISFGSVQTKKHTLLSSNDAVPDPLRS